GVTMALRSHALYDRAEGLHHVAILRRLGDLAQPGRFLHERHAHVFGELVGGRVGGAELRMVREELAPLTGSALGHAGRALDEAPDLNEVLIEKDEDGDGAELPL